MLNHWTTLATRYFCFEIRYAQRFRMQFILTCHDLFMCDMTHTSENGKSVENISFWRNLLTLSAKKTNAKTECFYIAHVSPICLFVREKIKVQHYNFNILLTNLNYFGMIFVHNNQKTELLLIYKLNKLFILLWNLNMRPSMQELLVLT